MIEPPTNGSATCLQFSLQNWEKITQNSRDNSWAQDPLVQAPQTVVRENYTSKKQLRCLPNETGNQKPDLNVKPQDDRFASTLFLVQKENDDFRPVINLWALNRFLGKESLKMEELQVLRSLLQQENFMMKMDLKDAYYALPIHQRSI